MRKGTTTARNGDVEIAYDCMGPPDGTPMILIPGSGMQRVMWMPGLCQALVERGFRVVRMDNRDSGGSTRLTGYDSRPWYRLKAYSIGDMADDVIAVVDALGVERAHLFGVSLSAVIALVAASRHPDRVASVTVQSAVPGTRPWQARPKLGTAMKMLRIMRGDSPDAAAEGRRWVALFRLLGSPGYPLDEEQWHNAGKLLFEAGGYAKGSARHTAAYAGAGDLRPALAKLTVPALVVQGRDDPLQSWRAGKAVADAIPGARFLLLPGVGHDLPREVWPTVLDEITAMTKSTQD